MSQPSRPNGASPSTGGTRGPADAADWRRLIDRLGCGVALFDAQRCLVYCNEDYRQLYGSMADEVVVGRRLEDMLHEAVERGQIPEAVGQEESWLEQRLQLRQLPGKPFLHRLPDGRWRRITETPQPEGGVLVLCVDVTEVAVNAEQIEAALRAARIATERLTDAVEVLPVGFELWDVHERLVLCNSELRRMYPEIAHLLVPGSQWEDLVRFNHARGALAVPADELEVYIRRRRAARRAGSVPGEHATGDGRWIRTVEHAARDGGLVCIRVDVTELRDQRAVAEKARLDADALRQRLTDAIEALPDGFALYDADDRLVIFNERFRSLYRESAPAMTPGARFEDVLRYGLDRGQYPQAAADPQAWLAERLHRHRHPGAPEIQQLPGNRWLRIDERMTREGGVAGVRTDVTELVRREQRLQELNAELDQARAEVERLAQTDALTGIANRRQFDSRLAEEWSRAARYASPLALLLIDVDHFKLYNDSYGHQAGDDCLRRVAAALAGCARRATDLVARYGGEEFAVLMPMTNADAAAALAACCIEAVDGQRIEHRASPVAGHLTLSVGVSVVASARNHESGALLRAADRALYRAKATGRHRAEIETLG